MTEAKYGGHWAEKLAPAQPEIIQGDLDKLVCHVCGKEINSSYRSDNGKHRHIGCIESIPTGYVLLSVEARKHLRPEDVPPVFDYRVEPMAGLVTGSNRGKSRVCVGEGLYDFPNSDLTPCTEQEAKRLNPTLGKTAALASAITGQPIGLEDYLSTLAEPTGRKDDNKPKPDRPRWDLMPWGPLGDVVKVLTFGAKRYSDFGWQTRANPKTDNFIAAMEHLIRYQSGEAQDKETGEHNLAHAICRLLFLLWFERGRK